MLFVYVCIAGGVVYAAASTLLARRPRKRAGWLVPLRGQPTGGPSAATQGGLMPPDETTTSRYFTIASVSFGLSASGALFYSPLALAVCL